MIQLYIFRRYNIDSLGKYDESESCLIDIQIWCQKKTHKDNAAEQAETSMELTQPEPLKLGANPAEGWKEFKQRFTFYADGTGLSKKAEKMQCAVLMHVIGKQGQDVYQSFTFEGDEDGKYEPLVRKFDAVFLPKTNLTYERYRFNSCVQKEEQPFDTFATEVRGLAKTCEFGELKNSLIKDRLVCGIRDLKLQEVLLREDPEDVDEVIKFCRASEIAHTQAAILKKSGSESSEVEEVHKMRVRSNTSRQAEWSRDPQSERPTAGRQCYYCGRSHAQGARNCPAYGKKCDKCEKMNHFSSVCRNRVVRNVDVQQSGEQSDFLFIGTVNTSADDQSGWKEIIKLMDHEVVFKLDPGANANTMSLRTYRGIGGDRRDLKHTTAQLVGYTENRTYPLGLVRLPCIIRGKTYEITFHVTEQELPNLLGLQMCEKANLVKRINQVEIDTPLTKELILEHYPDSFKGMGCLPYNIQLS